MKTILAIAFLLTINIGLDNAEKFKFDKYNIFPMYKYLNFFKIKTQSNKLQVGSTKSNK